MDNENQNMPTPTPTPAAEPVQPTPVVSSDPATTPVSPVGQKNNMMLLVLVAVIVIVIIALTFILMRSSRKTAPVNTTSIQPTASPSSTITPQSVTPVPVNSSQDVNSALQQVNNTDPASVGAILDQNSTDASKFAQ